MKIIETQVFEYNELSDESKEYALEKYRETAEYFWADEAIESLKAFVKHFGAELRDYSIDFYSCNYSDISLTSLYDPDDFDSETEYIKWLESKLFKESGRFNPETYKGLGDCVLTGYCADESLFDGARYEYMFNGNKDLKDIIEAGFYQWLDDCQEDYAYQCSEEAFSEHAQANNYLFLEDGSIY